MSCRPVAIGDTMLSILLNHSIMEPQLYVCPPWDRHC